MGGGSCIGGGSGPGAGSGTGAGPGGFGTPTGFNSLSSDKRIENAPVGCTAIRPALATIAYESAGAELLFGPAPAFCFLSLCLSFLKYLGSPDQIPRIGNLLKISLSRAAFQLMHTINSEEFDLCPQSAMRIGGYAVRLAKMLLDNAVGPAALFEIRRGVIVGHGFHPILLSALVEVGFPE